VRRAIQAIEETTSTEFFQPSTGVAAPRVELPAPTAPAPTPEPEAAPAAEAEETRSTAGERQSALQRLIAGLRSN
jgi:hypothetical protein